MKNIKRQGIILAAIIIIYTLIDIYSVSSLYLRYTEIIDTNVASINDLNNVRSCMDSIDYSILNAVYMPDKKVNESKIDAYLSKCVQSLMDYSELEKTEEENDVFINFNSYFQEYNNKVKSVITSISRNNFEKAKQIYSENILDIRSNSDMFLDKLSYLAVNNKNQQLDKVSKQGQINAVCTVVISVFVLILLIYFTRKQSKAELELEKNTKTIEKQKGTLNTAIFNDVLTDTFNRMAFINKYAKGKTQIEENTCYYFAMFNIDDFSSANIAYGTSSGDMILNSTAKILKESFENADIYRTGSDEFVVVYQTTSDAEGYKNISNLLDRARLQLAKPHKIRNGSLVVTYSVSLIKKTGPCSVDLSVLDPLKRSMKEGRITQPNAVIFTDLDFGKANV